MSTDSFQEIYEKKIRDFEKKYGTSEFSDVIRFTNTRIQANKEQTDVTFKQFDDSMDLFSQQTVNEFKKLWTKLKEIEARVPGQIVKPVPSPAPAPAPAEPPVVKPAEPEPPVEKPVKVAAKSK